MVVSIILFLASIVLLGAALALSMMGLIPVSHDVILQYGVPFVIALIPTKIKLVDGMGMVNSLTAQRVGINPSDQSKIEPEEADKWVALVIKVVVFILSLLKKKPSRYE